MVQQHSFSPSWGVDVSHEVFCDVSHNSAHGVVSPLAGFVALLAREGWFSEDEQESGDSPALDALTFDIVEEPHVLTVTMVWWPSSLSLGVEIEPDVVLADSEVARRRWREVLDRLGSGHPGLALGEMIHHDDGTVSWRGLITDDLDPEGLRNRLAETTHSLLLWLALVMDINTDSLLAAGAPLDTEWVT